MAKRKSLDALDIAAQAKAGGEDEGMVTTAIHITRDVHKLLRAVAYKRATETGGRPSVSGLLLELVERHRDELVDEAGGFLK